MTASQPKITLDPANHIYWCEGRQLKSVGSVVKSLIPKFNASYHAERIATRQGKTREAVLKEWDANRDSSADKGHFVHARINFRLNENPTFPEEPTGDALACENSPLSWRDFSAWLKWWEIAERSLKVQATEYIVGSLELGIAGTFDLLAESSKTNQKHIFDWKTNLKFRTKNQYGERLLPPFDDLPNCELTVYSLQVSLYRLLLEMQGEDCGEGWIIHTYEHTTPYRAYDLRKRLEVWLK